MGKALKSNEEPLNKNGLHLAIVIYWNPRDNSKLKNGHSALIIDSHNWMNSTEPPVGAMPGYVFDTAWYVSWLGGKVDWHPPKGSKKGGNKGVFNQYVEDMSQWGGDEAVALPGFGALNRPTRWVAISGLDTDAMYAAWDAARNKKGAHWRLFDKNCATMVHTILKAGGGDRLATGHKKQLVWWPSDLIRYAKSMTGHVYMKSSDAEAAFE